MLPLQAHAKLTCKGDGHGIGQRWRAILLAVEVKAAFFYENRRNSDELDHVHAPTLFLLAWTKQIRVHKPCPVSLSFCMPTSHLNES